MVVYEAAKAICTRKNVTTKELIPALAGWTFLFLFFLNPF